jgi:phosphoesterase RecJ-like protein
VRQGAIKASLRAKDAALRVDRIAADFNGGGHANAAGGRSDDSLEATTKRFEEILSLYKDILTIN